MKLEEVIERLESLKSNCQDEDEEALNLTIELMKWCKGCSTACLGVDLGRLKEYMKNPKLKYYESEVSE